MPPPSSMSAAPARPSGASGRPAAFMYARVAAGAATLPSPDITKIAASRTRPTSAILSCAVDERETLRVSTAAEMVAMVKSPMMRGSGGQPHGLANREIQGLLTILGTEVEPLGDDELRFDSDEVEHAAEVALEMLERRCGRALAVNSAARQRDDDPLTLGEALRPSLSVAK